MNGPRRFAILAVTLPLLLAGCDYFKPRAANPPVGPPIATDYSTPDATLQTIVLAVQAKGSSNAAAAYSGAFSDSTLHADIAGFHQAFSPIDIASWQAAGRSVPTDWNFRLESQFYDKGTQSLIQLKPSNYQLIWEGDPNNPDRIGDPTLLHRRYTLLAVGDDQQVTDIIARGFADLTLEQSSNGDWYITRWDDRQDPVPYDPTGKLTNVTWGQRRLEYQ